VWSNQQLRLNDGRFLNPVRLSLEHHIKNRRAFIFACYNFPSQHVDLSTTNYQKPAAKNQP